MISGVDYLGRDSLGLWQGKMGYIRKKCNYFMLVLHAENSLYLKPIQIVIIKKNKSSKYFKNKKNENAYFDLIICNGAK